MRRLLFVLVAAGMLLAAPGAQAGGPSMLIGAAEDAVKADTLTEAKARMDLLRVAGMDTVRVTSIWNPASPSPGADELLQLRNLTQAAALDGMKVFVAVYNFGSRTTPLTDGQQASFAGHAAALARAVPALRNFIIGNEPNLNRFWLPQFGRGGIDVAAPAYELLLARTYDAIKAVAPSAEVIGGALAHAGVNKRGSGRDTQAPTRFILDLGKAYRETKRTKPIMDAFAFHPYLEHANLPPTYKHYSPRIITIADYGRLVSVLGRAFDGTGQKGSKIPIVYAEFGVESRIPEALLPAYTGTEPATTRPVSESTQAKFYAKAMQMAACQPTVTTFFVFRLIDEQPRGGWQSGLFYFNGSPKASLVPVSLAAARLKEFGPSGCAALLQPQPRVTFFPGRKPSVRFPTVKPISLLCDADCIYDVRLLGIRGKLYGEGTGKVVAGTRIRVGVGEQSLARGTYRLAVRVTANDFKANPFKKTVTFTF